MPRLFSVKAASSALGKLVTLEKGAKGVDTSAAITKSQAAALKAKGYDFAIRYLALNGGPHVIPLTAAERDMLWSEGLAIGLVQTYRPAKTISSALGTSDGMYAVEQAIALGAPLGAQLWNDCEGVYPSAQLLMDYLNEWYIAVYGAGYIAGLYNGPEPNLNGAQLGESLLFTRYWKSDADVPTPEPRGYCLAQVSENIVIAGGAFDGNVTEIDNRGGTPVFWASA